MILILIAIILLIFIVFKFIIKNKQKGGALYIGPSAINKNNPYFDLFFPIFADSGLRHIISNTLFYLRRQYAPYYRRNVPFDRNILTAPHAIYGYLTYLVENELYDSIDNQYAPIHYNVEEYKLNKIDNPLDREFIKQSIDLFKQYDFNYDSLKYLRVQVSYLIIYFFVYMIMIHDKNLIRNEIINIEDLPVYRIYLSAITAIHSPVYYASIQNITVMLELLHKVVIMFDQQPPRNTFSYELGVSPLFLLNRPPPRQISPEERILRLQNRYPPWLDPDYDEFIIEPFDSDLSIAYMCLKDHIILKYRRFRYRLPSRPVFMTMEFTIKVDKNVKRFDYRSMNFEQQTELLTKINQVEKTYWLNDTTHSDLLFIGNRPIIEDSIYKFTQTVMFTDAGFVSYNQQGKLTFYNRMNKIVGDNNNTGPDNIDSLDFQINPLYPPIFINNRIENKQYTLDVALKQTLLYDVIECKYGFYFNNYKPVDMLPSAFYTDDVIQLLPPQEQPQANVIQQELLNIEGGDLSDLPLYSQILVQARRNEGLMGGPKVHYNYIEVPEITIDEVTGKADDVVSNDLQIPKTLTWPVVDYSKLESANPNQVNLYNCRHRSVREEYFQTISYRQGPSFIPIFNDSNFSLFGSIFGK